MFGVKHIRIRVALVALVMCLAAVSFAVAQETGTPDESAQTKVSGVVSQVKSGVVSVKTRWGHMSITSSEAPRDLKIGEEIELTINE
ncbi:MAG: hypothetical protein ACT4OO_00245, partial [Nitrospiraceae bacterium]